MASVLRKPTSFTDISGTWSTETNIYDASDSTVATATSSVTVHKIDLTTFDFASVIPADAASIDAITVRVVQSCSNVARFAAPNVRAYNSTTALGTGVYTLAEYTTLTSEDCALPGTFNVSDVRSANFLITYVHQQTSTSGSPTAQIAALEVTVDYTPANQTLAMNNAAQRVTSGSPALSQLMVLQTASGDQNVQSTTPAITQRHNLIVPAADQNVASGVPVLVQNRTLAVNSTVQRVTSGIPFVSINRVLSMNSTVQRVTSGVLTLTGSQFIFLTPSSANQSLRSSTVTMRGFINYVAPVSPNGIVATGTNLVTTDIRATLQLRSRFAGDTAVVDAVRFRALEKNASETILTSNEERLVLSDATIATDYRVRPQLFHREWGGLYIYGGTGPVQIDATDYPWKTIAFFVKPGTSPTTTIFNFNGTADTFSLTASGSQWTPSVPAGYTGYIKGAAISGNYDFTMPRLVVLTTASLKAGLLNFGSTGSGSLHSMSLNHIIIIPVTLSAGGVTELYKRFYGQHSIKLVDTLGTSGSLGAYGYSSNTWKIGTLT
jgi:hypothetical protein